MEPDPLLHEVQLRAPYGFSDISNMLPTDRLAEMADYSHKVTGVDATSLNSRPSWGSDMPPRTTAR
jgi:hypothetical protein